jgi:outer membrane protein assembly factor BamA
MKADRIRALLGRFLVMSLLPLLISVGGPYRSAAAQGTQSAQPTPPAQVPAPQPAPEAGPGVHEYDGRVVQAVAFHGTQALSEETLLFYLGLQIGKPLDEALLNRKIKELWDRSLVDDIKID